MANTNVTKHASKRIRKRLNLPKDAVSNNADRAYDHGITHAETSGSLNRYITKLYFNNENRANRITIYGHYIYVFKDQKLITVMALPEKYRGTVDRIQKRKNEEANQKIIDTTTI